MNVTDSVHLEHDNHRHVNTVNNNNNNNKSNTRLETCVLGWMVGTVTVITGHPLDTIKTRMQTHSTRVALFRNLYSGVLPTLVSAPLAWSIYWSVYESAMSTATCNYRCSSSTHAMYTRYASALLCGALAGALPCCFVCPQELIKCYAQRHHMSSRQAVRSMLNKFVCQNHEVILTSQPRIRSSWSTWLTRGVFRGYVATSVRDTLGLAAYFVCLEACREHMSGYEQSQLWMPFLCGTLNGLAFWLVAYPADCIKSKIQSDFVMARNIDELPSASFIRNSQTYIRQYGARKLYQGFGVILLRNPIVSGTSIVALETCQRYLDSRRTLH
mmetsp:Transcript_45937/g.73567  ORF Transcript_45937/g.73567 Transcript_45937/m.73567 type:complete len:328 (-) Transcript_45937:26-1009(-)